MNNEISEQTNEFEGQPSIDSSDPNERKLARQLRIQGRLEAARKLQAIADGTYVEPEPEKPLIDETIETCEDTLRQLYQEGRELVSNVMVASDAKEVERRETELEERNQRVDKLKEEAALALEKLDEISRRWEDILEATGPLELHQHMKDQKARCLDLIEQKNELIKGFQMELKLADEKFMKERKTMYEELSLLTRRIDDQVLLMRRAYRIELDHVEESVDVTRTQIIEGHSKIWQNLYNQREKDEKTNMDRKFKMVGSFHEELHKLHVDHEEKYRETRIQLETDVQVLEQELEQVKALCLLNSEKLDYNYQVLKKREEENVYIKNHQKRRMNKLQDMVNNLKKKIDEKRQSIEEEFKRLTKEVHRYYTNVLETEKKAEHFSEVNNDKFSHIWDMKDEEIRDLIDKILSADMVIHEQILGLPWSPPQVSFPNKGEMPSYKTAEMMVRDIRNRKSRQSERRSTGLKGLEKTGATPDVMEGHKRLLRHILELIADQTGFLMEEKLDELLKPYTEDEKTFVRLDNVFVAIDIRAEKDINTMKKIFLPYTTCLLCEKIDMSTSGDDFMDYKTKSESKHSILQIRELEEKVSKLRMQAKVEDTESSTVSSNKRDLFSAKGSPEIKGSMDSDELELRKEAPEPKREGSLSTKKDTRQKTVPRSSRWSKSSRNQEECNITHPLVVEKQNVLKALRDFVSFYHADRCKVLTGIDAILDKKRFTVSRLLSNDDISSYWEKYREILPSKMETVWNGIFKALTRYLTILQERHELNLKAKALRRQNLELKRLLAYYKVPDRRELLPGVPSVPAGPIDPEELAAIANKLPHHH